MELRKTLEERTRSIQDAAHDRMDGITQEHRTNHRDLHDKLTASVGDEVLNLKSMLKHSDERFTQHSNIVDDKLREHYTFLEEKGDYI